MNHCLCPCLLSVPTFVSAGSTGYASTPAVNLDSGFLTFGAGSTEATASLTEPTGSIGELDHDDDHQTLHHDH